MSDNKNSSLKLLKSMGAISKSEPSRTISIKSVYRMSPADSPEWLLGISADFNRLDPPVDLCMLELLPDMAVRDAHSSAQIFCNLLAPDSGAGHPGDATFPRPDLSTIVAGNEILADLLGTAPGEFSKAVLDIALRRLGAAPAARRPYTIDVGASPWYFSQERRRDGLLDKMEAKLAEWQDAGDDRFGAVLDALGSEPHSLAKLVLLEALARDPAPHARRILDAIKSSVGTSDVRSNLGRYLQKVMPVCSKAQVQEINDALLRVRLSQNPETEHKRRRSVLLAVPERFRTEATQDWLGAADAAPAREQGRGEWANPEDAGEALDMWDSADDAQKTDLLEHMRRFLGAGALGREHLGRLERAIQPYFADGRNGLPSSASIHAKESIEHKAVLCQTLLTAQSPSPANVSICKELSEHRDAGVRTGVAKGLARLSEANFEASFYMAKRLAKDRSPAPAYLAEYMDRIADRPAELLRLCELLIEARGTRQNASFQDRALYVAVSTTARMALARGDPGFSRLFERLVRDGSYNYAVKHWIALICKNVLHDERLSGRAVGAYSDLMDSEDPYVQGDAEYFSLYTLACDGRPLLPQIKPVLEKASRIDHGVSPHPAGLVLVEYLAKFWRAIPQESAAYLGRLCMNNRPMTVYNHRASLILDVTEAMLESGLLDGKSRQCLLETLMLFVRQGWPRACQILNAVERATLPR